ncbi:hypothetical protein EVAR_11311_1 [Eumeta japonica]|uniref:Uncharacterized protein n=1 Tax=Eumeta variegata TaxID=151549 RepID=A0A4C1U0Q7_EUMVA|nr:hypothetical protein EVAR_11311_1 [Eumeta japonica]
MVQEALIMAVRRSLRTQAEGCATSEEVKRNQRSVNSKIMRASASERNTLIAAFGSAEVLSLVFDGSSYTRLGVDRSVTTRINPYARIRITGIRDRAT